MNGILQNLRMLNLADNLLEEMVSRLFQQLTKLKYLDLSGNPLEDLTPDIFRDIMVRKFKSTWKIDKAIKKKLSYRIWKCWSVVDVDWKKLTHNFITSFSNCQSLILELIR